MGGDDLGGENDKPIPGDKLGDSVTGIIVAVILMMTAAVAMFITSKKRSHN